MGGGCGGRAISSCRKIMLIVKEPNTGSNDFS